MSLRATILGPIALALACTLAGCGGDESDEARLVFGPDDRPRRTLDVGSAWAAPHAPTTDRLAAFSVTLAATFPRRSQALEVGRELAAVLAASGRWLAEEATDADRAAHLRPDGVPPLSPPEAAWLRTHGVPRPPGGIGWAGPRHATAPPVQVLGSTVIVADLKYVSGWDRRPYASPLVSALAATGAQVLVEGDLHGQGAVAANVTCTGRSVAAGLGADLADYAALPVGFLARPPWSPDGLTPRQRQARRTYRLVVDAWSRRAGELLADPRITELARQTQQGSREEGREAFARLQKLLLEQTIDALPDLDDERLDPLVVSWFAADQAERVRANERAEQDPSVLLQPSSADELRAAAERELRRGRLMGQIRHTRVRGHPVPAPGADDDVLWFADVGWSDDRVDVFLALGPRIALAFPSLVRYLAEGGCGRLAYDLVDATD